MNASLPKPIDRIGRLFDHCPNGLLIAKPCAGDQRILDMRLKTILGIKYGRNSSLSPQARSRCQSGLGEDNAIDSLVGQA